MIKRILRYLQYANEIKRINLSLSRGAATAAIRTVNPRNPLSWEFSSFSQNGEDGIIDYLTEKIRNPNYYFIEIGSNDGLENNTSWLAIARKYSGLMVEGDSRLSQKCKNIISRLNLGVECSNLFIDKDNADQLFKTAMYKDPDLFSLDIDGNDYYIAEFMMNAGFRPKILVVEYNSAFGPTSSITVEYRNRLNNDLKNSLYYGVSIAGWRSLFKRYGYQFVSVERNGVNAFFINPEQFDIEFCKNIRGMDFQENFYQMQNLRMNWEKQYESMKHMPFTEI